MIDYAGFCQIQHLHEQQGLSAAQIAATLSRDPRTVAYWLTRSASGPESASTCESTRSVQSADGPDAGTLSLFRGPGFPTPG